MTTTEPTDEELREHLAAVQAMRDDFQRLWLGGLRDKCGTEEAAVWTAFRTDPEWRDHPQLTPLQGIFSEPPGDRLPTHPDVSV